VKCALLLLLCLLACERADRPPPAPDPVKQARAEFEVMPLDAARGTSLRYWRGDFMPGAGIDEQHDEGDFIGRLITLFGPADDREWVLRDRDNSEIITAYASDSGPAYGGVADPEANLAVASSIKRLDAVVSRVSPSDWDTTRYYAEPPRVVHIGAKGGRSFRDELEPARALAFLLDLAERTDPANNLYDVALTYYAAHRAALAAEKPHADEAYRRYVELAKQAGPEFRRDLLDRAEALKP